MRCSDVFLLFGLLLLSQFEGVCSQHGDTEYITAIVGESIILVCPLSHGSMPYKILWKREHIKTPIYMWHVGDDLYVGDDYKGRVSRVNSDTIFGLASLNLTSVRESDQGWYECKVYLDRSGAIHSHSWIHLDVLVPPRFTTTPDEVTYVNIGDSITFKCEGEGTPKPEILWFHGDYPVRFSDTIGIFHDGTELRINKIRDQDIGDYYCILRNTEGNIHHKTKVVIAVGAVIIMPPHNQTRLEGEKAEFPCEGEASLGNVTVTWEREGISIDKHSWLNARSIIRRNGSLVINSTSEDDAGYFTCKVSNGIGPPQRATAFLNIEYPAHVMYTPTVQYLPSGQQGIINCFIKSNPSIQFVTWIKDKRLFDADDADDVVKLSNGSLLITKVEQSHQGRYRCTPYNRHNTKGSSGVMEVLVRDPPIFNPVPQLQYHGQFGEEVTLVCGGLGTPTPEVTWKKGDRQNLPRDRIDIVGGNLTIHNLRKSDHGSYECIVSNDIATLVAETSLLVEGTTPHPPYNISSKTTPSSVKLSWFPGYPGGRDWEQQFTVWYRSQGFRTWSQTKPAGSMSLTINNLMPEHTYEFQVQGRNDLGDGSFSNVVTASTTAAEAETTTTAISEFEIDITTLIPPEETTTLVTTTSAEKIQKSDTAVGAVIITPPYNQTRLEGEKAELPCEAEASLGNVTVTWEREGVSIDKLSWLNTRSIIRRDGSLVIDPTTADDIGHFTCEVSNGNGTPQRATAFLNIEYPARVTYTPAVQYLPSGQQGIINCFIKSNPTVQFVTWIKDKRLFDADDAVNLSNGSLLITKVKQSHQGHYSCTPYNRHSTQGSSGDMEVQVREKNKESDELACKTKKCKDARMLGKLFSKIVLSFIKI